MGLLLALEGIDGCGKDTQAALLVDSLVERGLAASALAFPDYSSRMGQFISACLRDAAFDAACLQMLFSAERVGRRHEIAAQVASQDIVVTSRYSPSAVVYGEMRGLPPSWLAQLEVLLPVPHRILLLDLPTAVAAARAGGKDHLESNTTLQNQCRNAYLALAESNPAVWTVVDATPEQSVVAAKLVELASALVAPN